MGTREGSLFYAPFREGKVVFAAPVARPFSYPRWQSRPKGGRQSGRQRQRQSQREKAREGRLKKCAEMDERVGRALTGFAASFSLLLNMHNNSDVKEGPQADHVSFGANGPPPSPYD